MVTVNHTVWGTHLATRSNRGIDMVLEGTHLTTRSNRGTVLDMVLEGPHLTTGCLGWVVHATGKYQHLTGLPRLGLIRRRLSLCNSVEVTMWVRMVRAGSSMPQ